MSDGGASDGGGGFGWGGEAYNMNVEAGEPILAYGGPESGFALGGENIGTPNLEGGAVETTEQKPKPEQKMEKTPEAIRREEQKAGRKKRRRSLLGEEEEGELGKPNIFRRSLWGE